MLPFAAEILNMINHSIECFQNRKEGYNFAAHCKKCKILGDKVGLFCLVIPDVFSHDFILKVTKDILLYMQRKEILESFFFFSLLEYRPGREKRGARLQCCRECFVI